MKRKAVGQSEPERSASRPLRSQATACGLPGARFLSRPAAWCVLRATCKEMSSSQVLVKRERHGQAPGGPVAAGQSVIQSYTRFTETYRGLWLGLVTRFYWCTVRTSAGDSGFQRKPLRHERRSPGGSGGRRLRRFPPPSTPRLEVYSESFPHPLHPPARTLLRVVFFYKNIARERAMQRATPRR